MRLVFGNDQMNTFIVWGFWKPQMFTFTEGSAMVDANWQLTAVGQKYEDLMAEWDTDLILHTDADGRIQFTGFFGEYDILGEGIHGSFTLAKGTQEYTVVMPGVLVARGWELYR